MADSKISALDNLTSADPANDMIPIVDVSATPPASGNTKRISINNILACSPTATLASATITGDLTVDTNVLKVDSANNRVGIGNSIPAVGFDVGYSESVFGSSTSSGYSILNLIGTGTGSARYGSIRKNYDSPFDLRIRASNSNSDAPIIFELSNASTAMTLNATGLGVGGSPSGNAPMVLVEGAAGTYAKFNSKVGAKTWSAGYRSGTLQYEIQEDGTERFVIANGGNVGIGTTPKPWRSGARALQLGANGYVTLHEQANGNPNLCFAAYEGSANVFNYTTTGDLPSRYVLVSGTHQWFTAPSGTAGNAITWTQAMTLDASGRLILLASTTTPATLATNGELTFTATSNTNLRFSYRGSDGVTRTADLTLA